MTRATLLLALLLMGTSIGCGSLSPPNLHNPGPADYQRNQARQFDPYPHPELGPEVEGARPREYDEPRTETDPEKRPPLW